MDNGYHMALSWVEVFNISSYLYRHAYSYTYDWGPPDHQDSKRCDPYNAANKCERIPPPFLLWKNNKSFHPQISDSSVQVHSAMRDLSSDDWTKLILKRKEFIRQIYLWTDAQFLEQKVFNFLIHLIFINFLWWGQQSPEREYSLDVLYQVV